MYEATLASLVLFRSYHYVLTIYLPLLGHFAFLSMLSQSRAKNPATQVPLQAFPSCESLDCRGALLVVVVDVVVVLLVVVVVVVTGGGIPSFPGMTSSDGH